MIGLCLLAPLEVGAAESATGAVDLARLEQEGARFGRVSIHNQDVFDLAREDESSAAHRLANRWHHRTRKQVIDDTLLFKSGEPFQARLLEESARLLRTLKFLGDAHVEVVSAHDGVVDVEVTTRDVWSLNPGVSFGRKGGENDYGFEIEELNLLGLGLELDVDYTNNVDRSGYSVSVLDRHAFAPHRELSLGYGRFDDGDEWKFRYALPFYALDTRHAWGVQTQNRITRDDVYQRSEVVDQYRQRNTSGEIWYGYSTGWKDGWIQRWSGGWALDRRAFETTPESTGVAPLPRDRDLRSVWFGYEAIQDDYRQWENRNQIGRTEDVLLGTHLNVRLGRALEAFGGDRDAWLYSASVSRGFPLSAEKTLQARLSTEGRLEQGKVVDALSAVGLRYYHPLSERNLVFARLDYEHGNNLEFDRRLLLGGDTGLRGFPLRYQAGERKAQFTVEQRYFTDWYPFRIMRVGFAAFADVGRVWGDDGLGTENPGWLTNLGVGLRLGNTRSALGNVIHVDLAFPVGGPSDIDRLQFVIEARREF
ncbi:MAG: BamA/TamA family outer membrane protein [Xanthomonadales bacterium]|nr:BamA/TamA family outer membrane protein [Xanthomonadales bacterium]